MKSKLDKKLKELLKEYEEIKEQSFITANINKDFFFEFCDCLIEKNKRIKK